VSGQHDLREPTGRVASGVTNQQHKGSGCIDNGPAAITRQENGAFCETVDSITTPSRLKALDGNRAGNRSD